MSSTLKTIQNSSHMVKIMRGLLAADKANANEENSRDIKSSVATMYDDLASQGRMKNAFWNWGFWDEPVHRQISEKIPEYGTYETDGFSEQLYYFTLKQAPLQRLEGCKILEIGSGGGLGLNFLSRLEPRATLVGMDLSQAAVDRANAKFARPGLSYVQGDAENLPFGNGEFDLVINVESAHNYPNLGKFFSEVERVLRPGGYFSMVDVFTDARVELMAECKAKSPKRLKWLSEEDISDRVKAAIRRRIEPGSKLRELVKHGVVNVPFFIRPLLYRMSMFSFGAAFLKPPGESRMRSVLKTPPITSYRHALATKDAAS